MWQKLQEWKEKLLSQGDKEILIKVVAMPILNFTMSCFKLPKHFCIKLEQLMVQFWSAQRKENKKNSMGGLEKIVPTKGGAGGIGV